MPRFDTLAAWLAWQEGLHPRTIDLGLERAARVFRRLNPSGKKPVTLTVAGTNGKGSCIALLEAMYRAQGYRVGSYTSPHIVDYNERIRIDGKPVDDALICRSFARIDEARQETTLSYFEFSTLAALDIFSQADLDIQLLEVGLGGRLDAVNIVDADLTLVTTICIDHVDWLGETREAIGREKAGIFRPGIPVVIGDRQPPQSLLDVAEQLKAPVYRIGVDFDYRKTAESWQWHFNTLNKEDLPPPALPGAHQFANASTVMTAVTVFQPRLAISDAAIRQGLEQVHLAGRFQKIDGDVPILLDVGHNPQAVKALRDYLQQHFKHYKIHALFSMMQDKDIVQVVEIIKDVVTDWTLAPLRTPRTASEESMLAVFQQSDVKQVTAGFRDFSSAFKHVQQQAKNGELVLVFGSFFLISEFMAYQKSQLSA